MRVTVKSQPMFNRDEDGSCLTGGAIRMDSESSGQGKRQADNHHLTRPPKKKRRSEDEAEDYEEDGETVEDDRDAESDEDEEEDSDAESEEDEEDDNDAESEEFPELVGLPPRFFRPPKLSPEEEFPELVGLPTRFFRPPKLRSEEEFPELVGLPPRFFGQPKLSPEEEFPELVGLPPRFFGPPKLSHVQFVGNHLSLDGIHESDMKCDSEGSNEMAGESFRYVPRKARSLSQFVPGSVNFEDWDGNLNNCIELGKPIQFDVGCIDVTHSHNPKTCAWGDKYLYEIKHSLPAF